ncbi:UPF0481 protein At3g47200-like [Diospyros lotus]|uniref:UPF0481 protein At3g47200-like n=1 Tax=Diospyros lotus TaxID=55363 RepID=UPI0022559E14|nr:UPF0481 protein At3g47200-like [Diospyros lotus]XP_052208019.1 UPF0481 protein At3g47200-like [Diospyros lotus]XP_052208020.1 UPF0481 protein At3g47200-like [Diospyros lotus]XP_052208021.1 UPF0481 protein At3g47200-like [Diospyros lotus]
MAGITEITEQRVSIPLWVSAKGEIDINSTDPVNRVLCQIQKRIVRYSDWFGECWGQIYVNTVSPNDHKPILVSIGPNHWDTIKPDIMEVHKLKYLKDYVERKKIDVEQLVWNNLQGFKQIAFLDRELKGWRDRDDVFVEMCILDGCFIIELFMKNYTQREGLLNDPLFKSGWVLNALSRDLILPNNQLPFEVLDILCKRDFKLMASRFLEYIVPNQKLNHTSLHLEHVKTNLLSIVYDGLNWPGMSSGHYYNSNIDGDDKWNMVKSVKSATELEEFGVEFKMIKTPNFNIDINFTKKGVLEIPRLRIRYGTPYSIKVLLAYEQSRHQYKYLNNYLWFMNSLVKSPRDVRLLRHKKIIDNLSELPDDAAIHKFLKDLYASLMISPANFNYIQVCKDLNSHCKHRRNSWVAKLKRDYFNSPWAFVSFFAASLLLILTVVQTVFSVASYYEGYKRD